MRKLGEQWVEEIDGKKHMLKCVKQKAEISHIEEKNHPCHKCFFQMDDYDCAYPSDDWKCDMEKRTIIKDLGILNEDGCLPYPFCGEYPVLKLGIDENGWHYAELRCCSYVDRMTGYSTDMEGFFKGMIERWNRRA